MVKNRHMEYPIILYFSAAVWLINGLVCKLLNFVPRHQQIVAQLLGTGVASGATKAIGFAEVLMAVWIITRLKPRLCTGIQVIVIMTMNIIEFLYAPDLLLFGKINIILAAVFCLLILYNEFAVAKRL